MNQMINLCLAVMSLGVSLTFAEDAKQLDFAALEPSPPEYRGAQIKRDRAVLSDSDSWAWLRSKDVYTDLKLEARITIREPATRFAFFGQSWSVWPDKAFADQGFDAAFLLRGGPQSGYRVQLSHKYQCVALVKYPEGGYLRVAPCKVPLNEPQSLSASIRGNRIVVEVNGKPKIRYRDRLLPIAKGFVGLGVSSRARVEFQRMTLARLTPQVAPAKDTPHQPLFAVRKWLGGRPWVFDGDEPIMLLPIPGARYINNVKLRPGYKPLLSWNSHWGIENQGVYPAGESRNSEVSTSGGGNSLEVRWSSQQKAGRFNTETTMTVGYDRTRDVYTYDIESELTVLQGEPFYFRYGLDFEHHTPLDPFGWQYLVVRRKSGKLSYRPLSPFDPGPMNGVELSRGLRLWYGRSRGSQVVCPAVEYRFDPTWNLVSGAKGGRIARPCSTAVCAAFYDTGVSYAPETVPPGTKFRVRYRYTGYPVEEAKRLFETTTINENPNNDPEHHFIFAGNEWPKITFGNFLTMDKPWWGGRPFMSGHNARPTYELAKVPGIDNGFAMKLGPTSYAVASLAAPSPLPKGRYVVSALVKSVNTHGPGGRIEVLVTEKPVVNGYLRHGARILREVTHHLGNGTFDWKTVRFATEVPSGAGALALGLGNAGTGDVYVANVKFTRLNDTQPLPQDVLPRPKQAPPHLAQRQNGDLPLFDFRMEEQHGYYVYNYGSSSYRTLELANTDWVVDQGRSAIRFSANPPERQDYPKLGILDRHVRHPVYGPTYQKVKHVSVALAGHHGGGFEVNGLTVTAWVKPDAQMGGHGYGDVVGVGARRFILSLYGNKAPFRLGARLNVNDRFVSEIANIDTGRWHHLAMTCKQTSNRKWKVRLYVDGRQVAEGTTTRFAAPATLPPSLVLGAELFYLHDAYYRGLIGRTMVFPRSLSAAEIAGLTKH